MIVDTHAHVIVPEITQDVASEADWRPHVYWEAGRQIIEYAGKQIKSALREFVHIDAILEAQDAAGVDHVVLSPWVSILRYDTPPDEGRRSSQIQNGGIARLVAEYPNRVSGLGTVPLQDVELAARTLEELMASMPLAGVEIGASVRGVYLGDDRFRPFWEVAEATGAWVFIHPRGRQLGLPALDSFYLWNTVGNPTETALTAAHMIFAGVMERHPRLKVLLAHGGGTLMTLRGRLRHAYSTLPHARVRLEDPPDVSLKRFYFDTITHDAVLLRQLVEYAGADHVMLGSDYPFDMGLDRPADVVRELKLPTDDEAKILGGNAATLLGLEED